MKVPKDYPSKELMDEAHMAFNPEINTAEWDRVRQQTPILEHVEEGHKDDLNKEPFDLIAPEFLFGLARVLAFGRKKYTARNWEKGMSWGRVFGGSMRHLWAFWRGEELDPETGESHLLHAACCVMFLYIYWLRKIGKDDRNA